MVFEATSGWLSDRFGRKPVMIVPGVLLLLDPPVLLVIFTRRTSRRSKEPRRSWRCSLRSVGARHRHDHGVAAAPHPFGCGRDDLRSDPIWWFDAVRDQALIDRPMIRWRPRTTDRRGGRGSDRDEPGHQSAPVKKARVQRTRSSHAATPLAAPSGSATPAERAMPGPGPRTAPRSRSVRTSGKPRGKVVSQHAQIVFDIEVARAAGPRRDR
jgi:hypothetical protein